MFVDPPRIDLPPIDFYENEGGIARFRCLASGDPTPKVEWLMEGELLDSERSTVQQDNTLEIRNINPSDDGSMYFIFKYWETLHTFPNVLAACLECNCDWENHIGR